MKTPQQDTGQKGENLAKQYLVEKGYKIISENWRHGQLEVDLIAKNAQMLIFIEVKTRKLNSLIEPHMAVNKSKQTSIVRAAKAFVGRTQADEEIRFDIISVITDGIENQIEHIEDAFRSYGWR